MLYHNQTAELRELLEFAHMYLQSDDEVSGHLLSRLGHGRGGGTLDLFLGDLCAKAQPYLLAVSCPLPIPALRSPLHVLMFSFSRVSILPNSSPAQLKWEFLQEVLPACPGSAFWACNTDSDPLCLPGPGVICSPDLFPFLQPPSPASLSEARALGWGPGYSQLFHSACHRAGIGKLSLNDPVNE